MEDFKLFSEDMELLLRQGKLAEVGTALDAVLKSHKPKEQGVCVALSNFYRRSARPHAAVALLNSFVRNLEEKKLHESASPECLLAYAAALSRIGARSEAQDILLSRRVSEKLNPHFFLALNDMTEWNYESAKAHLELYLRQKSLSDYQRLTAQVNLAATLVYCHEQEEAQELLQELAAKTEKILPKLFANILELRAQVAITQEDWPKAEACLSQALELFRGETGLEVLFIKKWWQVFKLRQEPSEFHRKQLLNLQKQASDLAYWEVVRDCDYHLCAVFPDLRRLEKLYHGTPFAAYRQRLLPLLEQFPNFSPQEYVLVMGRGAQETILEPAVGRHSQREETLKILSAPHRLLVELFKDFYKPRSVAELFGAVFPGEYYHPRYSKLRIQQLVHKLNVWMQKDLHLGVSMHGDFVHLKAQGKIRVLLGAGTKASSEMVQKIKELKLAFDGEDFKKTDAARHLKMPDRSLVRFLKKAQSENLISALGQGARRRFKFLK